MTVGGSLKQPLFTLGAQSLSSLTNFLAGALALGAGDLAAFGRFSIAYQLCLVVIAVGQGSTGHSVLIHTAGDGEADAEAVGDGASSAALILGAFLGSALAASGLLVGGDMRVPLLIAGAGAVGLVAQYTLRAARFAEGDSLGAARADAIWMAVLLVFAVGDWIGVVDPNANAYLAVWLFGATISGLPVIVVGATRGWASLGTFWKTTGPQAVRTGLDGLLARSVFVVTLVFTEMIVGGEASGALAATVLAFSPMSVVNASAPALVVPAEIRAHGIHVAPVGVPFKVAATLCSVIAVWALVLLAVDASGGGFGPFDLSANGVTSALFAATLIRFLAMGSWMGPIVGLRIADAATRSLQARTIGTVAQWTLPVVGLVTAGLAGGAFGLAIGTCFGALVAWERFGSLAAPSSSP